MATKKFAGPSPYTLKSEHSPTDYDHTEYLNNVTTNLKVKSQKKPLVAAIFGLGRAGSIHLSNIIGNPRIVLKYIVDDQTSKFAALKSYWALSDDVIFITSKEAEKVYSDKTVNVVIIGSPTHTHHDIVMKSLANNKDVFCEKPIAENIKDTQKCYEAAKAKGRALYAAFNRRFDPAYRGLKMRARQGEVGHIQFLKVTARDSPLPTIDYLKTSGMIKVENEKPTHSVETMIGLQGINYNPIFYSFPSRFKTAYKLELEHFLDVVQEGVPMDVTSWQCLAVSKIATALEESARSGKVIELDWSRDGIPANYS